MKMLLVRYGLQPSECWSMTLVAVASLLESDDDGTITLADTAALHRWMASNG